MKARKYKELFRLRAEIDESTGRERRRAEYLGAHFAFPKDGATARERAARLAVPVAAYWAAALAYLLMAGPTGRCMYALVPFLLGLFPGAYAAMGLVAMARAPRRMTVVQRENGVARVLRNGLGCGVFSAAGTVGAVVCLSVEGVWRIGWHEPLLTAVAACAGFCAFVLARRDYRALREA